MNYLPFCGYWFYGTASGAEMASFYNSWGLLGVVPTITLRRVWSLISGFFNSNLLGG